MLDLIKDSFGVGVRCVSWTLQSAVEDGVIVTGTGSNIAVTSHLLLQNKNDNR